MGESLEDSQGGRLEQTCKTANIMKQVVKRVYIYNKELNHAINAALKKTFEKNAALSFILTKLTSYTYIHIYHIFY